jgi:RNA polymerase sigma-70 factor (ECF subfamily)
MPWRSSAAPIGIPLYAYVRRKGRVAQDAQDRIQGFFAHLLGKQAFGHLEREGGKFRSFRLTALNQRPG